MPAGRGTVVGLGGALWLTITGPVTTVRTVGAVGVSISVCSRSLGGLAGLCDSCLERGLGDRLGPGLAALDRQLARRLDRRLVRRDAATEIVEHGEPRPL